MRRIAMIAWLLAVGCGGSEFGTDGVGADAAVGGAAGAAAGAAGSQPYDGGSETSDAFTGGSGGTAGQSDASPPDGSAGVSGEGGTAGEAGAGGGAGPDAGDDVQTCDPGCEQTAAGCVCPVHECCDHGECAASGCWSGICQVGNACHLDKCRSWCVFCLGKSDGYCNSGDECQCED